MAAPERRPSTQSSGPSLRALLAAAAVSLLLIAMGAAALLWGATSGAWLGPTPTPSVTPAATLAPTADFRATRIAEDMATQVAYSAAVATLAAETLAGDAPGASGETKYLPVVVAPNPTAEWLAQQATRDAAAAQAAAQATAAALGTPSPDAVASPTPVIVNLPVVEGGSVPATAAPGVATAAPSVVATPVPLEAPPTATPSATPSETPSATPTPSPTFTPTPTFTLAPPTATATPFATPTPTVAFALNSMRAVVDRENAVARVGPGSLYTQTSVINVGTQVTLLARDSSGEWVYLCCTPGANAPAWVRSDNARPVDNPTLPPPLNTQNQNDIRWLVVRGPDANLSPVTSLPPVAAGDFPMYRRDQGNSGRVPQLPRLPLVTGWGGQSGLAGQSFSSGAVIAGAAVFAASADGHLYAFNRDTGSQLWRFNLGEVVRATPLVDGAQIYVVTESGRLVALENQGPAAVQRWAVPLGAAPRTALLPAPSRIVLTARQADGERLFVVDRANGSVLRNVPISVGQSVAPAVAAQTIYVASDLVRAYDLWTGELVWQSSEATQFTVAPVVVTPGVEAASELYVADAQGRLFALDANNGNVVWGAQVGGPPTGLAVSATNVYVSGPGFVRAFARVRRPEGQLLWSANTAGNAPGGPIVDDTRLLIAADGGAIQYIDAVTGALIAANVQAAPLAGHAAAVAPWLFAPGQNATLFAAREGP